MKTLVFTFGRFNPPTLGHWHLTMEMMKASIRYGAEDFPTVVLSYTHDNVRNPLSPERKMFWARRALPGVHLKLAETGNPDVFSFLRSVSDKYERIVMVAGDDRVARWKETITHYNGMEGQYHFGAIEVVSAGKRNPIDANLTVRTSGTLARSYAAKNDFTNFLQCMPPTLSELEGHALFQEVRSGLKYVQTDI